MFKGRFLLKCVILYWLLYWIGSCYAYSSGVWTKLHVRLDNYSPSFLPFVSKSMWLHILSRIRKNDPMVPPKT